MSVWIHVDHKYMIFHVEYNYILSMVLNFVFKSHLNMLSYQIQKIYIFCYEKYNFWYELQTLKHLRRKGGKD